MHQLLLEDHLLRPIHGKPQESRDDPVPADGGDGEMDIDLAPILGLVVHLPAPDPARGDSLPHVLVQAFGRQWRADDGDRLADQAFLIRVLVEVPVGIVDPQQDSAGIRDADREIRLEKRVFDQPRHGGSISLFHFSAPTSFDHARRCSAPA
jgi:hypothetical protein